MGTSSEQERAFEAILSGNLARVNDFLKFAEAKNAALLTFCSAWILGTFSFIAIYKVINPFVESAIALSALLLVIACGFCIYALLPQLSDSKFNKSPEKELANLFFGRIAKRSQNDFMDLINEHYTPSVNLFTKVYIEDIISQMHTASLIARRKFNLFNWAARITFGAIVLLTIAVNCQLFISLRH